MAATHSRDTPPRPTRSHKAADGGNLAKPRPVAPEPPRHSAPRGISALLAPVLCPVLARRGAVLGTLIADWPDIAGPDIASRSQPTKFAAGTLTLGCAGPDALALQHLAPVLIGKINLALGGAPVQRLRFTDMTVPAPIRRAAPASVTQAPPPAGLPDGDLGDALARLHRGLQRQRPGNRT
ncbi:MAG: hypothetical protein B7Z76_05070 [Acidiphilium sp. 20-67-58]|nr:MAG: hypothetical protein B7Z76_05070 [Acidiphilium sp. 20-67-58]OYV87341.1 MAG: hypothetical protein B7Z64_01680 [Acidiphilium sp. 21-68-69]